MVRVVKRADVSLLVAAFPEVEGTPGNRHEHRWRLQEAGVLTALAVWHGRCPIGYCIARWPVEGGDSTTQALQLGCAELGDVFVAESARRRGAGRLLVEAAESLARDRRERLIGLEVTVSNPFNEAARQLYAKLGYSEAGFGEFMSGYTYWTADGKEERDEEPHRYLVKAL
jgi:GNAT superfamily N-acetyltransferase